MSAASTKERQAAFKARQAAAGLVARRVWLSDAEVSAVIDATGEKAAGEALRAALLAFPAQAGGRGAGAALAALEAVRGVLEVWEEKLAEVSASSKNPGDWNRIPRFQNVHRMTEELRAALDGV